MSSCLPHKGGAYNRRMLILAADRQAYLMKQLAEVTEEIKLRASLEGADQ